MCLYLQEMAGLQEMVGLQEMAAERCARQILLERQILPCMIYDTIPIAG